MTFILISASYSKGHKRLKLSNYGKDRDNVSCSVSSDKPGTTSSVVDFSDPYAVQRMAEVVDGGEYGSVTKEIKALLAWKMQRFGAIFAKYPILTNKLLDFGNVQRKEDCHPTGYGNVIDLEDDNDEDEAPAAPLTIEISDSDEEDRGDMKPSYPFQVVDLKYPSGEVSMKDIEVIFLSYII